VENADEITRLLGEWRNGNGTAENDLFRLVFPHLHRLARYFIGRETKNYSLQATELVDEIYFRMVAAKDRDWRNRGHFFAIAARVIRRQLIDHARRQPDAEFVSFGGMENLLHVNRGGLETALTIDHLLNKLAIIHPDWCSVLELKHFLGLTDEQVAETLGLRLRSVQRAWQDARGWLFDQMNGNE
jgi:RNA polymerase sigma factor (TIGR02999 family)